MAILIIPFMNNRLVLKSCPKLFHIVTITSVPFTVNYEEISEYNKACHIKKSPMGIAKIDRLIQGHHLKQA